MCYVLTQGLDIGFYFDAQTFLQHKLEKPMGNSKEAADIICKALFTFSSFVVDVG